MIDTQNIVRIPTLLRVLDSTYNHMRHEFKDVMKDQVVQIRPHFAAPSKAQISGTAPSKIYGS